MSGQTKIEWATKVWNPVVGCQKVSEGCRNCYAEELHNRRHKAYQDGKLQNIPQYAKLFSEIQLLHDRIDEPLFWGKTQKVFVNSMSDIFHEDIPFEFLEEVFFTMNEESRHTFMILTKRPQRMRDFIEWLINKWSDDSVGLSWYPPNNIWFGVSVENQEAADERIPFLLNTPASVRFLSCEPLLGSIDLTSYLGFNDPKTKGPLIDWVIVGGETGTGARPMHPAWVRGLRDQCQEHKVPFFFKSWGEWISESDYRFGDWPNLYQRKSHIFENGITVYKTGKKKSGRLLDGREWNELPGEVRDDS